MIHIIDFMSKTIIKFQELDKYVFVDILHLLMRGKKVKIAPFVDHVGWRVVRIGYTVSDKGVNLIPSTMISATLKGQMSLDDTMPFPSFVDVKRLFDEDLQLVFVLPFYDENKEHHRYIAIDFLLQSVIVTTSLASLTTGKKRIIAFPGCSTSLIRDYDIKWWDIHLLGRIKMYAIALYVIYAASHEQCRENSKVNQYWALIQAAILRTDKDSSATFIYPSLSTFILPTMARDTHYSTILGMPPPYTLALSPHFRSDGLLQQIDHYFGHLSRVGIKMLQDIIFCNSSAESDFWIWFPGKQKEIQGEGVMLEIYDK
jgi:hypothetical protein